MFYSDGLVIWHDFSDLIHAKVNNGRVIFNLIDYTAQNYKKYKITLTPFSSKHTKTYTMRIPMADCGHNLETIILFYSTTTMFICLQVTIYGVRNTITHVMTYLL